MIEEFKKLFYAAIGSTAYTYEKLSNLVEELVRKGQLSMEQGRELSEELRRNFRDKSDKITPVTKTELNNALDELNSSIMKDIMDIRIRLDRLERGINIKEIEDNNF